MKNPWKNLSFANSETEWIFHLHIIIDVTDLNI